MLTGDISNKINESYSIVRLGKDRLPDLAKLHFEVYHSNITGDYFTQKYNTAFTDVECVGFIAYDKNNKPIAYYGVTPCFIQFENKKILSAQSVDTMTHPDHRQKGLVVELSNMTFDLCKELGIRLIFGFPNQNFYPIMIKRLGWKETEKLSRFELPVSKSLKNYFFKFSQKKRQLILQELRLAKKELTNSVIEDGFAGIYKDDEYFRYKAFSNSFLIRILSAELWVKISKQLMIGDVNLIRSDPQFFFSEIKDLAKKLGLDKITFQVSSDCSLHHFFSEYYQPITSFPVLFKDFGSGIPLEKIKFTLSDIDIF